MIKPPKQPIYLPLTCISCFCTCYDKHHSSSFMFLNLDLVGKESAVVIRICLARHHKGGTPL